MKRETVDEYLARGGTIQVIPVGVVARPEGMTERERELAKMYARRGQASGRLVQEGKRLGFGGKA